MRTGRLRRGVLWGLLVLLLASVVWSGDQGTASAFVPPPPVVAPPIVAPPTSPNIPGVDEDHPVWCIWAPGSWGCPSEAPNPDIPPDNPYVGEPAPGPSPWAGSVPGGSFEVAHGQAINVVGGVAATDGPLDGRGPSYSNAWAATMTGFDIATEAIVIDRWYAVQGFVNNGHYIRVDLKFDGDGGSGSDALHFRIVEDGVVKLTGGKSGDPGCNLLRDEVTRVVLSIGIEKPESGNVRFYGWAVSAPCNSLNPGMGNPNEWARIFNGGDYTSSVFDSMNTPGSTMTVGGGFVDGGYTADMLPGFVISSLYWPDIQSGGGWTHWINAWASFASLVTMPGTVTPWITDVPDQSSPPVTEVQPSPSTTAPAPVPSTIPEVETPDPALSPDTQGLIERIGGFFGDLIGALWNAIAWLAGQIWNAIRWLAEQLWAIARWFLNQLLTFLLWFLSLILEALRILTQLLGDLLSLAISWLVSIWNAIVSGFSALGSLLVSLFQWLVNALLAGIQVFFEWLLGGISLLFEWLIDALMELLITLFVPDVDFDVWLGSLDVDGEHPIIPWVDLVGDNVSFGAQCGPTMSFGEPINHDIHIPAPSTSGCPGNGEGGARTEGDNLAGDFWGYRVAIRTFMAFLLVWFVGMRVLRSFPWANKGEMVDPEPDASTVAPA